MLMTPVETSVIVVHGVGDPLPGNALEKLIQGLTVAGWQVAEPTRIEHQLEGEAAPAFPVARASVRSADGQDILRIREVYWGDLSRPKASLFGLVSALFDLIFGLRYVVTATVSQLKGSAYAGAQLARAALWWARGPMFALNIIAATVCLTYVVLLSVPWPFGDAPPVTAPVPAVLLGSMIVFGAGWLVRRRAKELHWSPATGDAMMALAPIAAWAGWAMRGSLEHDLVAFIGVAAGSTDGITDAMVIGALAMAFMALSSLLLCLFGVAASAQNRRPLIVVTFCTSLALGLFTFVVVTMWVLIGKAIREDTADRVARCLKTPRKSLEACLDSKSDVTPGTMLADRVVDGIHLLPWVVFGLVGMAACFLLVVFGNWLRAQRGVKRSYRYIVSPLVAFAGITVGALYAGVFVCLAFSFLGGSAELPGWVQAAGLKPFALTLTAAMAGAVVATRSHFLIALDLVLDVIMHFRTEGEGLLGRQGRHVVWERVLARFQRVMHEELSRSSRGVVVVSHSQGTTIAAHALGALTVEDLEVMPVAGAQQRVWLMTMGSPIEHLYQHYMPSRYRVVASAVARWRHLYRTDDFIGTTINGSGGDGGEEIGIGGHSDYWSDTKVVGRVIDSVREAAALP